MDAMQVYNRLPVALQNLACYVEGKRIAKTRYGKQFWKYLSEYEERSSWNYEQLCEFRDKRLRKMIRHCYDTVPYYKKCFDEGGINPESIRNLADLRVFPILKKECVKENIESLTSAKIRAKEIITASTGGTTGAGLRYRTTNCENEEQWAVWWRYRRNHGIKFDTMCGNLGGKMIVPLEQRKPPYWRHNEPNHQIYFSSYHIMVENAKSYAGFIKKSGLLWLHGYASSISLLADNLIDEGIRIPMKWISVGSENIYDIQKEKIKMAFGVIPIQHYGLTEGVANISENLDHELIVDEDFSCVEFVPTNNKDEYRIVGTALTKYAMPLIRYDTGDIAIIKEADRHNEKGRVIERIGGRDTESVILPGGGKVGAAAISLSIHDFHFIRSMQIVQKKRDFLEVRIVRNFTAHDFDEKKLYFSLHERFGDKMNIKVKYVDKLWKEKNGKTRLVISELDSNEDKGIKD